MYVKTAYHMHGNKFNIICTPNTFVSYIRQIVFVCFLDQYHEFLFLFGILVIHIFMRPGSRMFFFSIQDYLYSAFMIQSLQSSFTSIDLYIAET